MGRTAKIPRSITVTTALSCVVGILVSIYAYHVETSHERDPSYRALCDISESISCTKVFSTRWGKGFGLMPEGSILNQHNTIYGMAYYLTQSLLMISGSTVATMFQLAFSVICMSGSVYLAYILIYVLQDFCVVCFSMHAINLVILVCCAMKYRAVSSQQTTAGKQQSKKSR